MISRPIGRPPCPASLAGGRRGMKNYEFLGLKENQLPSFLHVWNSEQLVCALVYIIIYDSIGTCFIQAPSIKPEMVSKTISNPPVIHASA